MTKLSERITKIETTNHIQYKEIFFRLRRLERDIISYQDTTYQQVNRRKE